MREKRLRSIRRKAVKVRDLVMITDSREVGRVNAAVTFPTGLKYRVMLDNGHTRHKRPSELRVIESAPKEVKDNSQMELKFT